MDGLKVGLMAAVLAVSMAEQRAEQKAAKMGPLTAGQLAANSDELKVVPSVDVKASKSAVSMVDIWESPSEDLKAVKLGD